MDRIKKSIRKYWNWRSDSYGYDADKSIIIADRWASILEELVAEAPGKKALDIGTGRGQIALYLASLGFAVTGIDLSERMIQHAAQNAAAKALHIDFQTGDAEKLSFEDNTFDIVVSRNLLWTLPNPESAMKEWRRVLKPGGTIIISDGFWMNYTWKRIHQLTLKLVKEKFQNGSLVSLRFFTSYTGLRKSLPYYEGISFDKTHKLLQAASFRDIKSYDVSCFDKHPYQKKGSENVKPTFFIAHARV